MKGPSPRWKKCGGPSPSGPTTSDAYDHNPYPNEGQMSEEQRSVHGIIESRTVERLVDSTTPVAEAAAWRNMMWLLRGDAAIWWDATEYDQTTELDPAGINTVYNWATAL